MLAHHLRWMFVSRFFLCQKKPFWSSAHLQEPFLLPHITISVNETRFLPVSFFFPRICLYKMYIYCMYIIYTWWSSQGHIKVQRFRKQFWSHIFPVIKVLFWHRKPRPDNEGISKWVCGDQATLLREHFCRRLWESASETQDYTGPRYAILHVSNCSFSEDIVRKIISDNDSWEKGKTWRNCFRQCKIF